MKSKVNNNGGKANYKIELHRRSIVKAITWRLSGMVVTSLTGWYVTDSIRIGIGLGLIDSFIKIIAFYFHERVWHKIKWGFVEEQVSHGEGEFI